MASNDRRATRDWLTSDEAAERLGVTVGHVRWLAGRGRLPASRVAGRIRIDASHVDAVVQERVAWVSRATAAEIIGCTLYAVWSAAASGELETRRAPRHKPAISRASVEAWAARWRSEQRLKQQRREAVERERRARLAVSGPPEDGDVWLDAGATAVVLGISRSRVSQLARVDRLPHVRRGRRLWFRRTHVEQIAAARAWQRTRTEASVPSG